MNKIEEILETIDISKLDRNIEIDDIGSDEFDIHDWIEQTKNKAKLSYYYYHSWTCTDTKVGIRVWYFCSKPVCISFKLYRKSREKYHWLSENDYQNVGTYLKSLSPNNSNFNIADEETISKILEMADKVDYKQHEKKNIKTV